LGNQQFVTCKAIFLTKNLERMKKILLSLIVLGSLGLTAKVQAQCNLTTPLIKYTSGTGIAPFNIGELPNSIVDWETFILGTGTGNATTPFIPPAASAANYSIDGTGAIGPDLDGPTPPRDLRFFAFTYDNYNVYFYFRRIINSNSQNTFMYIMDINADGFMNDGEPVIRANFNSGGVAAFNIHQYIANTGTDYVAGKGNYMTKPTAPNAGLADGYSVAGSMNSTGEILPALLANEKFAASVTEGGFGVEFAVPWRFLKNYLTNTPPLTVGDVFTYHVGTQNGTGQYNTSGAEDNAGGCCSGLAVVGIAKYTVDTVFVHELVKNLKYRASLKVTNTGNAPIKVALNEVSMDQIDSFSLRTIDPTDFVFEGYIDANGNGIIDGTDAGTLKTFAYVSGSAGVPPIIYSSPVPKDTISIPAFGTGYFIVDFRLPTNYSVHKIGSVLFETSGNLNLPLGPCDRPSVTAAGAIFIVIETTLPVAFQSFTAVRNHSNVLLKWATSQENNSRGFAVERNTNGTWEEMAFVPSQATGGNSSDLLSYQYTDVNDVKGISQYRIRQVDFDSKSKFTEIRIVRGESQIGKIVVYPNPTFNGKVSVSFEDASQQRDVSLMDMGGRVLKQWKALTNNNITIEDLTPGMYALKVVIPDTGEQNVMKIVVSKH
jgi:hypothetical protein